MHVLHHKTMYTGYFSHILHLDIITSEINSKLKVKINKILIAIWFSMGIDHIAIPTYTVLPYCVIVGGAVGVVLATLIIAVSLAVSVVRTYWKKASYKMDRDNIYE